MGRPGGGDRPTRVLRGGEFYSPVVNQERQEHLLMTELRQPEGSALPRHEHELAYVAVVLDGGYAEGTRNGLTELHPFTAIFNPSGVVHTAVVGQMGARLFTIECGSWFLEQLDVRLPAHPVVDPGTGAMLWPGMRLFSAFKARTTDRLVLESHLVEMLGAIAGSRLGDTPPRWFHRVKDRLHSQFRESLRVFDLAAEAGVHPVHLARVFRAQERQTPGGYVQRLRVRAACDLLRDRDTSLAGVAADCGFSDQSHFTRTFKKIVGTTPGGFRRALLGRAPSAR